MPAGHELATERITKNKGLLRFTYPIVVKEARVYDLRERYHHYNLYLFSNILSCVDLRDRKRNVRLPYSSKVQANLTRVS
jgi:hypothetical protein